MEGADSFVNWGFNPESRGSKHNFAISYGWGSSGESGSNLITFKDLKSALIHFRRNIWENYEYFWDDIWGYIDADGATLTAYNTTIAGSKGESARMLEFASWKNVGYDRVNRKGLFEMTKEYSKQRINIPNLTHTIPYEEDRFGEMGGDDIGEYDSADAKYYRDALDNSNLKEYTEDLNRNYEGNRPLPLISYTWDDDYNSVTGTLYYLP